MKDDIKPQIIMLLRVASSSDLIGAVLGLAQTADFLGGEQRIQADVITSACKRAHALYDGIKALELQAVQPLMLGSPAQPKGKRLSLSHSRDKRKLASSRTESHMVWPPPPLLNRCLCVWFEGCVRMRARHARSHSLARITPTHRTVHARRQAVRRG